jgi:PAS domain S-box-containing protein
MKHKTETAGAHRISFLPLLARTLFLAVAYFALAALGRYLSYPEGSFTAFWPPEGLYIGALLLSDRRRWPLYMLGASAANFAFELINGRELLPALIFCVGDAMVALAVALLVRRFVARTPRLDSLKELLVFLFFVVLGSTIEATIGAFVTALREGFGSFVLTWRAWWSGDVLGVIIFCPVLLRGKYFFRKARTAMPSRRIAEAALLFVGLFISTWLVFSTGSSLPAVRAYLLLPFLLWAALRFGLQGAVVANLMLAVIVVQRSSRGFGEFAAAGTLGYPLTLTVQTFLAIVAVATLILAAALAERTRAEEASHDSRRLLERSSTSLSSAVFIIEASSIRIIDCNPAASRIFGYSREEMVGQTTAFLHVSEESLAEFQMLLARAVAQDGVLDNFEFRMKRKDGTVIQTQHSVTPIDDKRGGG